MIKLRRGHQGGHQSIVAVSYKNREFGPDRHKQRGNYVKTSGEDDPSTSQGAPEQEERPGQILPHSLEGTSPADTLILDLQPPELGDDRFLLFKLPNLWYFETNTHTFSRQLTHTLQATNFLWFESCAPKGYVQVLTPRTCRCDLIWK